jgi:hypothetical protein
VYKLDMPAVRRAGLIGRRGFARTKQRKGLALNSKASPVRRPSVPEDFHGRDLRLDACRGLALWFIFLDHVPNNIFSWLTLRNYGFSDTTEVFLFVSGYTCMLAYGRALQQDGWLSSAARAVRRSSEIYIAFLLLVMAYIAVIQAFGDGQPFIDETNTATFFGQPGPAILHTFMMQYMPVNTDILPTFVLMHLMFPALLWLLIRIPSIALGASILLYVLVQAFSWNLPSWPRGEWFFNPLAWQVLFVFGAWYAIEGYRKLKGMLQSRAALTVALLYIVFSVCVTLSWHGKALEGFLPELKLIYPIDKSNLAPLRLLHFLALAVVATRLFPLDWRLPIKPWLTVIVRCGENSLAIYCLGVLLSFIGHVVLVKISGALVAQIGVSLTGIAVMVGASLLLTWISELDTRGPKLF